MDQDIAVRTAFDEYVAGLELPEYAVPFEASPDFPVIKYHKGVNVVSGFKPTKYTGWHIAIEQSAELDNLFAGMGVPVVRVKHLGGDEVNYWQLNTIDGYILCRSVPPIKGYGPDVWQSTGVPYVWNDCKDTYMYGSQLQVLFFLKGLLDLGYTQPLILTLSRTVTEHFVQKVLRRQEAFLEAVKRAFRKSGKVANLAFYAYWMTIAKDEEETTTKGGGSYYSPAMVIAPPLTIEYVKEHQALPAHLEVIESFVPQWDAWAQAASQRLLEPPRDNAVVESPETEGAPANENVVTGSNVTPINNNATIKAANDALYKAAMKARQRSMDAQLVKSDRDWIALCETAGIVEFNKPDDIRVINDLIKELMNGKAS